MFIYRTLRYVDACCSCSNANSNSLSGPIIQVCLGEEGAQQTISVHQNILTARSEFFKRATNGKWGEARVVPLPEDQPEDFSRYVNILYKGEVATKGPEEWLDLCHLYILAEKLQDVRTKNSVIEAMLCFLKTSTVKEMVGFGQTGEKHYQMSAESIEELYAHTPEGSPVRRLVANYYADIAKDGWLIEGKAVFPADFLYDVAVRALQNRPSMMMSVWLQGGHAQYLEAETPNSADAREVAE
jgi:hypothetical protein